MDILRVIYLGHNAEQPLMCPPGELADGFEPHDTICSQLVPGVHATLMTVVQVVYPGWWRQVGTWEGLYRVLPPQPV